MALGISAWGIIALAEMLWEGGGFFSGFDLLLSQWYGGNVPGGVAMLLYGAMQVARRHLTIKVVMVAATIYFIPLILVQLCLLALVALPPEIKENVGLWSIGFVIGLPLVIFYIAGLGVGFLRRRQSLTRVAAGWLAPPLLAVIGAIVILWLGRIAPSPYWAYRDMFAISTPRIEQQQGSVVMETSLEVKRDGRFRFQAFYNKWFALSEGAGRGIPVQWTDTGAEGPQKAGTYQMRLVWKAASDDPSLMMRPTYPSVRQEFVLSISASSGSGILLLREIHIPVPPPGPG